MRTTTLLVSALALASILTLASAAAAQQEVRKIEQPVFVGQADKVQIDLTVGELTVEGIDGRDLQVEVALDCTREDLEECKRRAERLRLQTRLRSSKVSLQLEGSSRGRAEGIQARMKVLVPRQLALEVDVRAGDVAISGMRANVEVDTGVGDVDITYDRDRVKSVKLDVGIGQADLWLSDSRIEGTGFPRALNWYGSGESEIEVDVATGDVAVRLP